MGICIYITENIIPHGQHFLPLEKFPPSGNRTSLGQVPHALASLRKGNCPLEIRFPWWIFSTGRKRQPCGKYIFTENSVNVNLVCNKRCPLIIKNRLFHIYMFEHSKTFISHF